MFKLDDGRHFLYQWDCNRRVKVSDPTVKLVHFFNAYSTNAIEVETYEENGALYANIPNELLRDPWSIKVCRYDESYTSIPSIFNVYPRKKPAGYVYTNSEVRTWEAIIARLSAVEKELAELKAANGGGE